jgi:hypothetical protein
MNCLMGLLRLKVRGGSDKEGISTGGLKMALSEEPLKRVWDNEDDDVYN